MSVRFFPVSVCVRGDTGIPDRTAIDEINALLDGRYEVQALDPAQFVVGPTEIAALEQTDLIRSIMTRAAPSEPGPKGVSLKEQTERMMATLTPKEREVLDARRAGEQSDRTAVPRSGPPCADYAPAWFVLHWKEWHRGHGCDKDDGRPRSTEAQDHIDQRPKPRPLDPPGLNRTPRPASVLPGQPSKRKRKR